MHKHYHISIDNAKYIVRDSGEDTTQYWTVPDVRLIGHLKNCIMTCDIDLYAGHEGTGTWITRVGDLEELPEDMQQFHTDNLTLLLKHLAGVAPRPPEAVE